MRTRRPTLVELEALRATVVYGGAAAAARRLGCAQSSISRALAQLESRLGVPLFERVGRSIRPTAEALAVNSELDGVFDALDRIGGRPPAVSERLVVAAPPAFAVGLVTRAAARLRLRHPDTVIQIELASSSEIVTMVAERHADIGITDSAPLHAGIRLEPFRRSWAACLMPAGHPLSVRKTIRPEDLADVAFIALTRRHSMRARIDALFTELEVSRRIVAETSSAISAIELVRAGIGVAVLNPYPLLRDGASKLTLRRFEPSLEYRSCCVLPTDGPPTPLARRFQRLLGTGQGADRWSQRC